MVKETGRVAVGLDITVKVGLGVLVEVGCSGEEGG
jgi:hypothetical protein